MSSGYAELIAFLSDALVLFDLSGNAQRAGIAQWLKPWPRVPMALRVDGRAKHSEPATADRRIN